MYTECFRLSGGAQHDDADIRRVCGHVYDSYNMNDVPRRALCGAGLKARPEGDILGTFRGSRGAHHEVEEADIRRVRGHARERVLDRRTLFEAQPRELVLVARRPPIVHVDEPRVANVVLHHLQHDEPVARSFQGSFQLRFRADVLNTRVYGVGVCRLRCEEGIGVVGLAAGALDDTGCDARNARTAPPCTRPRPPSMHACGPHVDRVRS